jgi:hypothetical protein
MNTAYMLVEARIDSENTLSASTSDPTMNARYDSGDFSPIVEDIALVELDGGGSEFSWSSICSGRPKSDTPASETPPDNAVSALQGPIPSDDSTIGSGRVSGSYLSTKKHSLYFWDSIMFKVRLGPS